MSFAQDQRTFGMVAVSFSMTSMWHLGETICQSPAVPNKISLHMMLFHGGRKKFPKLGTGSRAGEQIMRMMRMMMMIYIYIYHICNPQHHQHHHHHHHYHQQQVVSLPLSAPCPSDDDQRHGWDLSGNLLESAEKVGGELIQVCSGKSLWMTVKEVLI